MARNVANILTERLFLRGIDETDTNSIVVWRSDPSVYIYFKNPHRISREEHLDWYRNHYLYNDNRFDWMCCDKATNARVGIFGMIRENDKVEINYLLAPEAQHKGYAAEVVRELIRYAQDKWNIKLVKAEIHKENVASISLVKKMNFHIMERKGPFVVYVLEV